MRRVLLAVVLALLVLPADAPAAAADDITVRSLTRDGQVLVSFTLTGGFTVELRDAIRSGLPATITYEVELRRSGVLWFGRTLASARVTASVQYDNLTRQYQLSLTIDGRGEAPRITENEDTVREWMTDFRRLPLFTTTALEPNVEYSVRVRARTRPRVNWFLFWPWEQDSATGDHRFTFVQ